MAWQQDLKTCHRLSVFPPLSRMSPSSLLSSLFASAFPISFSPRPPIFTFLSPSPLSPLHLLSPSSSLSPYISFLSPISFSLVALSVFSSSSFHPVSTPFSSCLSFFVFPLFPSPLSLSTFPPLSHVSLHPFSHISSLLSPPCSPSAPSLSPPYLSNVQTSSYRVCSGFLYINGTWHRQLQFHLFPVS